MSNNIPTSSIARPYKIYPIGLKVYHLATLHKVRHCTYVVVHYLARHNAGIDLKNSFVEKFGEKIGVFVPNTARFCKIWIITLDFEENANFFAKIGKNCRKL
jgi:hypothetical protein